MRYRMLAIDLDGTLLCSHGRISPENLEAIERAQQADVLVVPCTGRSWHESRSLLAPIATLKLGVFVGGAMVNSIHSSESVNLAVMTPQLARRLVDLLYDQPEAVLVFRDRHQAGHDYLITGRGELTPVTQWWFEQNKAWVHYTPKPTEQDLHHALRIGVVATEPRMREVTADLTAALGDQIVIQHFAARHVPDAFDAIHVLEIFASGVDKWRGLRWIASQHEIDDQQIAAIGDEINDVAMMTQAGCGVAMANAVEAVKQAARFVTRSNDEHGVAHAIDQLLSGQWG